MEKVCLCLPIICCYQNNVCCMYIVMHVCVCVCVKEQRGDVIHVKELMASTNNIVHALAR